MNNIRVDFTDVKKVIDNLFTERKEKDKLKKVSDTIKISKDDFIYWIKFIKELDKECNLLENQMSNLFDDFFGIVKLRKHSNKISEWLSKKVNDKNYHGTTIDWWLYEAESVFKNKKDWVITFTKPKEFDFVVNTPEQLYDFFVKSAELD